MGSQLISKRFACFNYIGIDISKQVITTLNNTKHVNDQQSNKPLISIRTQNERRIKFMIRYDRICLSVYVYANCCVALLIYTRFSSQ